MIQFTPGSPLISDAPLPPVQVGERIYHLIAELYPICRSITGNGVRQTLRALQERIPLVVHEVPSGTRVFDWTVPNEWNIFDAYIKNPDGEKIVDFKESNLHVMSYSVPVRKRLPLAALKEHLFTLPEHPDWIPYRTSYYRENWGFCLSHRHLTQLPEGDYEVCINATLEPGSLTYGEYYLPGERADEVLISCHICHPSLCNDNLSGIALVTALAETLSEMPRKFSYRCLFIPGAIGAITWLSLNEAGLARIRNGLVVACVGDPGRSTYKKSRRGDAAIDRAFDHVLRHSGRDHAIRDFVPYGFDERQFCSPGFNLPVGCFTRSSHDQFPEYHTSADNLSLVKPHALEESFSTCLAALSLLEQNEVYVNQNPKGEPQLGRRGLYSPVGGASAGRADELTLLWVLNLSDGTHSLLDIADRAGLDFESIRRAADTLARHGLLEKVSTAGTTDEAGGLET